MHNDWSISLDKKKWVVNVAIAVVVEVANVDKLGGEVRARCGGGGWWIVYIGGQCLAWPIYIFGWRMIGGDGWML